MLRRAVAMFVAAAVAALLPLALQHNAAAADGVTCPAKVSVEQELIDKPADWAEAVDSLPTELAGLAVFDGPPAERVQLVQDDDIEADKTWTSVWNLPANPRGYWITCQYANTTVTLSRALPPSATRCEIVRDRMVRFGSGQPVVTSMICSAAAP